MFDSLLQEKEDRAAVVTVLASLLPSPALLLFVNHPVLFVQLDFGRLLLLASAIGFGVLFASLFLVSSVAGARLARQQALRSRNGEPRSTDTGLKDWPLLFQTATVANTAMLVLTAWGYWHPLRIGATLVLVVAIEALLALILHGLILLWPLDWTNPTKSA